MSRKRSPVWQHFNCEGEIKRCKICNKSVIADKNTSNLIAHLRVNHKNEYSELFSNHESSDQPKIDETISDMENFASNGDRIDDALLWLIVKRNLPFNFVQSNEFIRLCQALNRRYKPPKRTRLMNMLQTLYQSKLDQAKSFFEMIKWFCITTDSWKDTKNQCSYIAITVHFIDNYKPGCICLKANSVNSVSMTSSVIKNIINDTLTEFNLDSSKLVAIVTDGGSNFVAAANGLSKHIHCCAHLLNLVIVDLLKEAKEACELISKVRNIVTVFKKSSTLMNDLFHEQKRENGDEFIPLKLKQDIETRWNSEFLMIKRYLKLNLEISSVLRKNNMRRDDLTDDELIFLEDLSKVLEPIFEMTEDISGSNYITISRIIPLLSLVKTKVTRTRVVHQLAKKFQQSLLNCLNRRFKDFEDNDFFAYATLLDPRFKKLVFESTSACSRKVTDLSLSLGDIELSQRPVMQTCEQGLWAIHDIRVNRLSNPLSGASHGLKHFLESDVVPRESDPLEFWKNNKNNWPQLHNLFLKHSVVQATSVPSERVFSKTGLIITELRSQIKPKHVDMLCFLSSLPDFFR